jgi:hypothetical protein
MESSCLFITLVFPRPPDKLPPAAARRRGQLAGVAADLERVARNLTGSSRSERERLRLTSDERLTTTSIKARTVISRRRRCRGTGNGGAAATCSASAATVAAPNKERRNSATGVVIRELARRWLGQLTEGPPGPRRPGRRGLRAELRGAPAADHMADVSGAEDVVGNVSGPERLAALIARAAAAHRYSSAWLRRRPYISRSAVSTTAAAVPGSFITTGASGGCLFPWRGSRGGGGAAPSPLPVK